MKNITRRQFGKTLSGAAAITSNSLSQIEFSQAAWPRTLQFPSKFLWGCASSAYQIEGAVNEEGRKLSIWDTFSHTPGKTFQGQTGDIADDSYHLYKEDVKLLKSLGVGAYRFSVSWPRIFPEGKSQPNEKGVAYYQRLV